LQSSLTRAKKKFDRLLGEVDMDLRAEWLAWDEGDQAARLAAQEEWWRCWTGGATSAIWSAT
jgi:hypothetical protein